MGKSTLKIALQICLNNYFINLKIIFFIWIYNMLGLLKQKKLNNALCHFNFFRGRHKI